MNTLAKDENFLLILHDILTLTKVMLPNMQQPRGH